MRAANIVFAVPIAPAQDVEKLGDVAIQIRKAFDANGIKFAFPTVNVAAATRLPSISGEQAA